MVPPTSCRVSRVPQYSGFCPLPTLFRLRGFHPLRPRFPACSSTYQLTCDSPLPRNARIAVWALSLSLAATQEIDVSFSSSPYLDVSVQAVPLIQLCIYCMMAGVLPAGFPHSEISGSADICSSPLLIAACHVLLRLLMPRHPPCALSCLTFLRIALRFWSGCSHYASSYHLFPVIHLDVLISFISVSMCSFQGTVRTSCFSRFNGDKGIRTLDPLLARQVLSQLSYTPIFEIFNFKKFQIDIGLLFSI